MRRSFTALDLVQLPRLDATGAQTLATSVLSAAKDESLSASVKEAHDEVATALDGLGRAARRRLPNGRDPARARNADTRVDAAWSAIYTWLAGWAKAPGIPEAKLAATLSEQLFADGLRFTQLAFRLEWAESNTRLSFIKQNKLDASFDALGGAKLLKVVRDAHKAYGDALGVTTSGELEDDGTAVRDAFDALMEALRNYVLQVSAAVRKKNPKSAALAQKLLQPITEWETTGAKATAAGDATESGGSAGTTSNDAETADATEAATSPAPDPKKKPEPVS